MNCSVIRYLGHAGFAVEHAGLRVLIDPWFHSAFLQSWFPWPDNSSARKIAETKFDYLYVSHAHEDHFDRRFLETLDKTTTILAPNYRSRGMLRRFNELGFANVVPLDHRQSFELADNFTATMFLDTSHKEDSGLMLEMDGFRFLDLNDCNTPMSELPDRVDLLAAQYSGAMWYPNCYDYPPEQMQQKVNAVREGLLDTLYRKVHLTHARAYLPSAGPACFLDPVLEKYNDPVKTIFPQWEDIAADFARACPSTDVLRLYPADGVEIAAGELRVSHSPDALREDDLASYRERRKDDWGSFYEGPETPIEASEVEDYFASLQRRNKPLLREFHKHIGISSGGRTWGVQLGKLAEDFVIEGEEPYDPEYVLIMSPRILRAILAGETGWEEALLSMRIDLHREPDVFDLTFMSLLRYGNEPAQTQQIMRERRNTETIERDGFRIQRFCPHAGEELAHATIADGILECPRHHWKWDVNTGRCIEGGTLPLKIEHIEKCGKASDPAMDLPSA
ncbi:UDP-MurNAc hydroxylase [Rhizobium subbaraonis]|uniref:UDP-MurNAc hydroxylase n=1 Tax=Rhizobium subbaraonis TaxID=908946 RepID=A0A285UIA5_9HYPH|nr:MBL fold metallo-hydrolase [Rhizobium subbaraonis]SOC41644.1 UDP-MurNAc hydroxylase [Rhizobium subbaraonis]